MVLWQCAFKEGTGTPKRSTKNEQQGEQGINKKITEQKSKPRTLWGCVGIHVNHKIVNKNTAPKLILNLHPPKTNGWNEKKAGGRCFSKFSFWWYFQVPAGSFLGCVRIWNSHSLKTKHDSKSALKPHGRKGQRCRTERINVWIYI